MVSGKGDDEEGANVLNVRIWVEDAVLEYEPRCIAKTAEKILTKYWHAGGRSDADTKGNPKLETVRGRYLRGTMKRRVLMCWLKAGER